MSAHFEGSTIDEAWLAAVEGVNDAADGRMIFTTVTVNHPQIEPDPRIRGVVDAALIQKGRPTTQRVANTLFALSFYQDPEITWSPDLEPAQLEQIDRASSALYDRYIFALPTLMTLKANAGGTYFSRMINWPGSAEPGGINQLAKRIHYLRGARARGDKSHNASDITMSAETIEPEELQGVQVYAASDDRQQAFPCLVHISITVHQGKLSLCATYRHWYLITRGYGNLIGLARLQRFLAQQSGYEVGSLMVVGTKANAERDRWGGRRGVQTILSDASAAATRENTEPIAVGG